MSDEEFLIWLDLVLNKIGIGADFSCTNSAFINHLLKEKQFPLTSGDIFKEYFGGFDHETFASLYGRAFLDYESKILDDFYWDVHRFLMINVLPRFFWELPYPKDEAINFLAESVKLTELVLDMGSDFYKKYQNFEIYLDSLPAQIKSQFWSTYNLSLQKLKKFFSIQTIKDSYKWVKSTSKWVYYNFDEILEWSQIRYDWLRLHYEWLYNEFSNFLVMVWSLSWEDYHNFYQWYARHIRLLGGIVDLDHGVSEYNLLFIVFIR